MNLQDRFFLWVSFRGGRRSAGVIFPAGALLSVAGGCFGAADDRTYTSVWSCTSFPP